MKRVLVLILLISGVARAQTPPKYTKISQRYEWLAGKFNERLGIPVTDTLTAPLFLGEVRLRTADNGLYYCVSLTGQKWVKAGGGSGVTSVNASASGALGFSGGPVTASGTLLLEWQGLASQYVRGNGTLGDFFDDVSAINDLRYSLSGHTHISSEITDLTTVVRNMFSGGSGISVNQTTGVISWPGTGVITSLNGLNGPDQTFVAEGNVSISSVGTAHMFNVPFGVDSLKQSNDSVYAKVNGDWRFQYVQAGGAGEVTQAQLDDSLSAVRADFPTATGVTQEQLDDSTAAIRGDMDFNLVVQPAGVGEQVLFDRNDSLFHKKITGDKWITVTTTSDSTIHIGVDTTNAALKAYIALYGNDGGGSGGMDSLEVVANDADAVNNIWINSTLKRIGFRTDSFYYHLPITDSVRYVEAASTYDADAQAYFDAVTAAGGTLSTTKKDAWDAFVRAAKSASLWSKFIAFYPYGGGVAAAHAINAKQPGTFNITWTGTVGTNTIHDADGVDFDGTVGAGNTGFKPSVQTGIFNIDESSLGVYITDSNAGGAIGANDIGLKSTGIWLIEARDPTDRAGWNFGYPGSPGYTAGNTDAKGVYMLIKSVTNNERKLYKNGTALVSLTASTSPTTDLAEFLQVGTAEYATPTSGWHSNRKQGFAFVAASFTATEVATLTTLFNNLKTAWGR